MTTVYFVRHAQPNKANLNDRERELSEKGMKDRKLVTKFLADKGVDAVLSSPFKRAVDTVGDFAHTFGFSITTDEDFRERATGIWTGDNFERFIEAQWNDFDYKLPDGDSMNEVQQRNIRGLSRVLSQYKDKTVVIGSHGMALSSVVKFYDPDFDFVTFRKWLDLMPWVAKFSFDHDRCVGIEHFNLFELNDTQSENTLPIRG